MNTEPLHIIKIGGKVLEEAGLLDQVLENFVSLSGSKILVHGGGKRASALSLRLGIEPKMHHGRRITEADALEVAIMVYAGLANKTLVSRLQARGCDAIGLSGADGNAILAHKRPVKEIDYGFVGDVDEVNTGFIRLLLKAHTAPVFCAITHDGQGQLLNTNADTIAGQLARALSPFYHVQLYYCFEKPGVLYDAGDDESLIEKLSYADYRQYQRDGIITDGMLPKLDNAFQALREGVKGVIICGPYSLNGQGTKLSL
jgi:acetylglutamate kinase